MTATKQNPKDFTNQYYRYAYRAGAKYGYNALFLLAQSAFESGWGNDTHTKAKAFAGIIGTKGWKGASFTTSDGRTFRQYPTFWAGFQDHADLFYNNAMKQGYYLPIHNALRGNSIEVFANAVAQSPYITELNGR